jgi:hypothetical protein
MVEEKLPAKVEMFRYEDQRNRSYLSVEVMENGDLNMGGHDLGEAPQRVWGHEDYEYDVKVPAKYKDYLLMLLIKEKFTGNKPSSDFMEWLKANKISYDFFTWP